jgi:hypothetical protein
MALQFSALAALSAATSGSVRAGVDVLEQPAVEPGRVVHAEQADVAHGLEELAELRAQALGRDRNAHQALE